MKKGIIILIVLLVIGATGLFLLRGNNKDEGNPKEFVKVQKGELVISIKESGYLNAVDEEKIKNQCSTKQLNVVEVVENGTLVSKGDFLIELDAAPLEEEKLKAEDQILLVMVELEEAKNTLAITKSEVESAVSKASSEINFAQMDFEKFQKLEKTSKLDDALAEIDSAKDELKLSEQTYKASVELAEKGFETKSKVDRDKLDLAVKETKLKSAESKLQALKLYDLKKEALQLETFVNEAVSKLEREKKEGENKTQRAQAKVSGVEAKLESAKLSLQLIKEEILKTKILSPVTGYALYPKSKDGRSEQNIEKGKAVYRNQTLMRIPNMDDMKIDVNVAEHFVNDVKVGQKAIVTVDSLKDKKFSAEVTHVSLLPITQSYWERAGSQKYTVTVNVDDSELPDDIKPQISASAEIFVDEIQDSLFVPVQAVHTEKGKQIVYIKSNNELGYESRDIKIGKMNTNHIQILEGIKENDEVLISEL